MLRERILTVLALGAVLAAPSGEALAQGAAWPNRPIRFIVPLPPGGANDLLARVFAERLQPVLGQPLVVENKPGAGGNVGKESVASKPADGYPILLSSNTHVINVSMFSKLPYDPFKDFDPVTIVATIPVALTVSSNLPVNTVKEFLADGRAHPGSRYGTAGIGTPHHMGAELLRSMTGIDIVHVPYKGAAFLVPALLSSEVTFSIASISSLVPHFKSGKLRAIAIADDVRTPILPDVPTIAEAGPLPRVKINVSVRLLAPPGTPRPIVDGLTTEINRTLQDPQLL